jgi:hypothetical protein
MIPRIIIKPRIIEYSGAAKLMARLGIKRVFIADEQHRELWDEMQLQARFASSGQPEWSPSCEIRIEGIVFNTESVWNGIMDCMSDCNQDFGGGKKCPINIRPPG